MLSNTIHDNNIYDYIIRKMIDDETEQSEKEFLSNGFANGTFYSSIVAVLFNGSEEHIDRSPKLWTE